MRDPGCKNGDGIPGGCVDRCRVNGVRSRVRGIIAAEQLTVFLLTVCLQITIKRFWKFWKFWKCEEVR